MTLPEANLANQLLVAMPELEAAKVKVGQTDIAVDWRRHAGGVDIAIKGPALELQRVRDMLHNRNHVAARKTVSIRPNDAVKVSGVDDAELRRMHTDSLPMPSALVDTLRHEGARVVATAARLAAEQQ